MTTAVLFQFGLFAGFSRKLIVFTTKFLLVDRVGVTSMRVLIAGSLQEAHCRLIASLNGGVEILNIVVVVGRAGISDFGNAKRAGCDWGWRPTASNEATSGAAM